MISQEFAIEYAPLFKTKARYIHLWGGRGRGGSHTATQYFLHLLTRPVYFRGYFMREVFSDIRESLWRDLKDRVDENETLDENDISLNETSMTAVHVNGNTIGSKGFKKSSGNRTAKLKSLAGASHILIEEADEISEEDFKQLDDSVRTKKSDLQIVMIFNPPKKNHWIWKRWYILTESKTNPGFFEAKPKTDPSLLSIFSTYHNNVDNLNESYISNMEGYKVTDKDYYGRMVLGLISEGARGRIYRDWKPIVSMPTYQKFYGLDFGFNDPVALVELQVHNKSLFVDEKIYKSGMTNRELSEEMTRLGISKTDMIVADSAEPKSIKELREYGWYIVEAEKGPDSVVTGVKFLKTFDVHVTERSSNLWVEYEEYRWHLDQNKNPTDTPEDECNHAMDAIRYGVTGKLRSIPKISIA